MMVDPNGIEGLDAEFIGRVSPTAPRIQAGGYPCQGIYWTEAGKRPKVAIIATHYNVDFSEHYIAPYFARQSFGFLGWNTRYRGVEDQFLLEHAVLDIGVGMKWLKEEAGVEQIVILGNSGGGSLMGAYQAEAIAPTLTGIAEPLAGWAAVGLAVVMVGAMAMHSKLAVTEQQPKEWRNVVVNVALLVVCLFVAAYWL